MSYTVNATYSATASRLNLGSVTFTTKVMLPTRALLKAVEVLTGLVILSGVGLWLFAI